MKSLFKINVFTYIFLIMSMLAGYFREIIIVYLILIIHELGHFFIMKYYNIKVNYIYIYPYGGMIDSEILINTNSKKVFLISLGGVLIQLFLFFLIFILFKLNIINEYYYLIFKKYNLFIIIFNLLPMYPLDGFKIFNSTFEMFFSFKKSIYISIFLNIIILLCFLLYLYIFKVSNYIIIIFLLVSLVNYIKSIRYIFNKFYIERVIYDIKYNGLVSVKNKKDMYKNKYNYINGISEDIYLKYYIN